MCPICSTFMLLPVDAKQPQIASRRPTPDPKSALIVVCCPLGFLKSCRTTKTEREMAAPNFKPQSYLPVFTLNPTNLRAQFIGRKTLWASLATLVDDYLWIVCDIIKPKGGPSICDQLKGPLSIESTPHIWKEKVPLITKLEIGLGNPWMTWDYSVEGARFLDDLIARIIFLTSTILVDCLADVIFRGNSHSLLFGCCDTWKNHEKPLIALLFTCFL